MYQNFVPTWLVIISVQAYINFPACGVPLINISAMYRDCVFFGCE